MPTRFKLKLSRVIPSSFHICRPKRAASLVETPIKSIYRLSPFNPKALDINYPNHPTPQPSTLHQPSIKSHVSRKFVSVGCRCQSISCSHYLSDSSFESLDFAWTKEEANRQAKPHSHIDGGSFFFDESNGDMSPVVITGRKKNRNKENKKDRIINVSSFDSGRFSSDDVVEENEETETLLYSSRSFSYDSSYEFSHSLENIIQKSDNETKFGKKKVSNNVKKIRKLGRRVSRKWKRSSKTMSSSPEISSPLRASVLRRMITCTVDGKVKESMAIVKKSEDPHKDFKRSMLEMILEKQMFEAEDLEELLQCFLSLNSRQYHGAIVQAFSEIWEIMFCDSPVKKRASVRL